MPTAPDQPPSKANVTGGLFAALIVVSVVGFFVGLPVIVWVFLIAAFIGLWYATAGRRGKDWGTDRQDRPWRNDRTDEK